MIVSFWEENTAEHLNLCLHFPMLHEHARDGYFACSDVLLSEHINYIETWLARVCLNSIPSSRCHRNRSACIRFSPFLLSWESVTTMPGISSAFFACVILDVLQFYTSSAINVWFIYHKPNNGFTFFPYERMELCQIFTGKNTTLNYCLERKKCKIQSNGSKWVVKIEI